MSTQNATISYGTENGNPFVQLRVEVRPAIMDSPWGFSQNLKWRLSGANSISGDFADDGVIIPMGLYGLVHDIAPYYRTERVPIEFLELMVVPTWDQHIYNLQAWQKWIVNKCFASTYDTIYAATSGAVQPIHSYRYDTYDGYNRFVYGDFQTIFNLDGWLQDRQKQARGFFKVNCYDQSALVQVSLALGTRE